MSPRRLYLNVGINSTGYAVHSWRLSSAGPRAFAEYGHYASLARVAHAGRFDALFFSDHPALAVDSAARPPHSLDPLVLLTALAATVPDIGLLVTVSSTYNSPYNLARRVATLDHISGGRVICNIVSSFNPDVAANFGGAALPPREARYRQAHEFVSVLHKLWDSWHLQPPPQGDGVWDPGTARRISHKGEFYSIAGPLNVPVGPQGRPVIGQAGASDRGLDFAARWGEIIYCSHLAHEAARTFSRALRERALAYGRPSSALKVIPGLVPVIGRTTKEALERHDAVSGAGSEAALLARFEREAGLKPGSIDPDAPLGRDIFKVHPDQQRPVGFTQSLADLIGYERVSAREFIRRVEGGHRLVVGTPEEIADSIIDWWQSGAVDGFTVLPPVLPDDLTEFVEKVIPILQARGVFPRDYVGATIRERFELPAPASADREPAAQLDQAG